MDGEADDALEAAISTALETDAALAERMAGLEVSMAAIAGVYDKRRTNAPPMPNLTPATPLRGVTPGAQEDALQLAAVPEGIGIDLAALLQAHGLTFKWAQLLGFNGKALVQISYLRDDGTPVARCVIPAGPDAKALNMGAAEGLDVARWNTPG